MFSVVFDRRIAISICLIAVCLVFSGGKSLAKAQLAQYLLENSWQKTNLTNRPTPWPGADTFPVAKMTIKRLAYSAVVLHGVSGEALAFGPGHLSTSAPPGYRGNAVIAGHRDTHFSILKDLQHGDLIKIERTDGETITYRVTELKIVDESDVSVLNSGSEIELTLITCYPFNAVTAGGPLRYVISATSLREDAEINA